MYLSLVIIIIIIIIIIQDSLVSIATRYELGGPGFEFRWGAKFCPPIQTDPGAHPASYKIGAGFLLRDKEAGAWR
jgi:hypothetical protein